MDRSSSHPVGRGVLTLLLGLIVSLASAAPEERGSAKLENRYPAASHVPDSQSGWEKFQTVAEDEAPMDEPMGGFTAAGTPVHKRNAHCFPAEARNLFWQVDMVFNETSGKLEPFDYRNGEFVDDRGRNAVRGQNTWMLWSEGNETFWNWLQQDGYGLADFMILLDSRKRSTRFRDTGMINQPGMKSSTVVNALGLFLDIADGNKVLMTQPDYDRNVDGELARRPEAPGDHQDAQHTETFEPYDRQAYAQIMRTLAQDGVDTNVYGYPSGVVGLRLFPNPDFFGKTTAARQARAYWKARVQSDPQRYYESASIAADPRLVRPFRVGMSCAFCHVGPHPLNPPKNPEEPAWENLSSVIGNQYWTTDRIFSNLLQAGMKRDDGAPASRPEPSNFLRQFLGSQQPGTVDTSLVSTDHINNANTIISVFDIPSRLGRARSNQPEQQGAANLLLQSIEEVNQSVNPRHTPRILVDGADSVGAYGALARVYLNIGTHSSQWARCHNPVVGFKPQRPFSIATLKAKSVYWNAADRYRIPALAAFFTHVDKTKNKNVASPMKLAHVEGGAQIIAAESADAALGKAVFIDNCAICHSSKQPDGFALRFSREWSKAPPPKADAMALTLPYDFAEWKAFKESGAYATYREAMRDLEKNPRDGKDFLEDNFLANEVRIPVTLVGTNSGRAVATNAMRGQVWDNFSSETYKSLEAVGPVRFFNPYSRAALDEWGNNDYYLPPPGGPGYYRPASLIGLWATAPYLHNNSLGILTRDPSVQGRLAAFEDGIDRLFNRDYRLRQKSTVDGDLRFIARDLASRDVGMIYRTTETTQIAFNASFVHPLLAGILGEGGVAFTTLWLWVGLVVIFLVLALFARPRHAGFVLTLLAVLAAIAIVIGRFDRIAWQLWLIPTLVVAAAFFFFVGKSRPLHSQIIFVALALGCGWIGYVAHGFAAGERGGISVGPIPRGTPVNLIMNMNPEAPIGKLLRGTTALIRAIYLSARVPGDDPGSEAARLRVFESEAGQALLEASKCPDFVLDRGHWFAEDLSADQKRQLKAFLRTL